MTSIRLWAAALLAALVVAGASLTQQPVFKKKTTESAPTPISVDQIVDRIMAFDKNKDGKITRDELPERMHHLFALGDSNKDGALDRDEIRKLASAQSAGPGFGGFGEFTPIVRSGFVGPESGPEAVVEDLRLTGKKKEQALAAVKAHQENVKKLLEQARADLLSKMKEILSEEELKDFAAGLDRPRAVTSVNIGPAIKKSVKKVGE